MFPASPVPGKNGGAWSTGSSSSSAMAPQLSRRTSTQTGHHYNNNNNRPKTSPYGLDSTKAEKDALPVPSTSGWKATGSSGGPLSLSRLHAHLPRWLRGLRALVALGLIFASVCTMLYIVSSTDAAAKEARKAAIQAEALLEDPSTFHRPAPAAALRNYSPAYLRDKLKWPFAASSKKKPVEVTGMNPQQAAPLQGQHQQSNTYHPNGLYVAHTDTKHPILSLIEKAERDWAEKEAGQSRTLKEAVSEYKKRYRRNPPKGFEKWWAYVQQHKVQLPDEYDQIHRDLAPFWALEPHDLKHRAKVMQERDHTFTLVIQDGEVSIEGEFAHLRRAKDIADVIRRFADDLPQHVNMTFIMDDSPAVMLEYERRERMAELAEQGEYFGPSDFASDDAHNSLTNYARACSPNSPLRRQERGEALSRDVADLLAQKSFIWDQRKANDLCQHPEIRPLHGHTVITGTDLTPIVPLFAWAKMPTHADILVTPLEQYWDSYEGYDPDWARKSQNKLLWRGTTTGAEFRKDTNWRESQRARLHFMAKETKGSKDVLWAGRDGVAKLSPFPVTSLNHLYMDTSFTGVPAQCDPETCDIMAKEIDFAPVQGLEESFQYKYVMDVDGNAWSGRFHRLMSGRCLVLKSTIFPEWYADRIMPWYHFVPVKVDYSDLYDIMAFFVGTPDGHGSHDDLAHRLAENGRHWAKRYWRREDMASYMFRLVLEYSRLMHQDEDGDYLA